MPLALCVVNKALVISNAEVFVVWCILTCEIRSLKSVYLRKLHFVVSKGNLGLIRNWFSKLARPKEPKLSWTDRQRFVALRDRGVRILGAASEEPGFKHLEAKVRQELGLYSRWNYAYTEATRLRKSEILAVQQVPGLAEVFLFHGDGIVREAAIDNLQGPLMVPCSVFALFWRLNDWAPPVRRAALQAVARVMPWTSAVVIVPAVKAVLPHFRTWQRWGTRGPEALEALLHREDVATLLLQEVAATQQSGLGLIFRELCRSPHVDAHLEHVFLHAPLPHVRMMALDMLLSNEAWWRVQKTKIEWIDRSIGVGRRVHERAKRELTVKVDPLNLVKAAVKDKAAMVRKRAADAVIALRHQPQIFEDLEKIAVDLLQDPNVGVRARAEFFMRKCAEERSK